MEFTGSLFDTNAHVNYWEGIVVDRNEWPRTDTPIKDAKELNNWGYRVKVRIQGIHPADKNILPDSKLPWIELPGSFFGSGHRGAGITPGVTQGSIVWGIWAVPSLKKTPIILGVKQNNEQTNLSRTQVGGFDPFSGFSDTDTVPGYSVPLTEGNPLEGIAFGNYWNQSDAGKMEEYTFGIDSPKPCTTSPLSEIQLTIQSLIQKIEKVQRQLKTWASSAQGWIADKQAYINRLIEEAAKKVAEGIRWLMETVRKYVMEFVQDRIKRLYYLINPSDRDKAKKAQDKVVELITCLFNKIINGLLGIVLGLLRNALGRFVNVPKCVVENIMSSLLGNLFGFIGGAIDNILSSISSLIGGIASVADGILGLLKTILGFFSCDDQNDCPETTQWNIWGGGRPSATFDLESIFNEAKNIASTVKNVVDPDNFNFDFTGMFSNLASGANSCFTGPVLCGPPRVEFFGGGGKGASANAIVSAAGEIMGVDIITPGSGYTRAPFVNIVDDCGKGKGAVVRAIIGPVNTQTPSSGTTNNTGTGTGTGTGTDTGTGTGVGAGTGTGTGTDTGTGGGTTAGTGTGTSETLGVVSVVVEESGFDYIPSPDGDLGGDGRIWATANQTIVRRSDGTYDDPYNPDDEILNLTDGDFVSTPDDRSSAVNFGSGVGQGVAGDGFVVRNFPSSNIGEYPVLLYLCDVEVVRSGINYSPTDPIIIEPNINGAILEPVWGPFGVLEKVNIISSGIGFTERPQIYVKSDTGYNAQLNPVFCVNRVGDDTEGELPPDITPDKILKVVDCVGIV